MEKLKTTEGQEFLHNGDQAIELIPAPGPGKRILVFRKDGRRYATIIDDDPTPKLQGGLYHSLIEGQECRAAIDVKRL